MQADSALYPAPGPASREGAAPKIAIIGIAGHYPGASHNAGLWEQLQAGRQPAHAWADLARFDAAFFGIADQEAALLDPAQRHFLECAWEALEDSGYEPQSCGRVGVYASAGPTRYLLSNLLPAAALSGEPRERLFLANDKDHLPTRVSYHLDLRGPSQSGGSSSLVAVHVACQALVRGECELALVGGASAQPGQVGGSGAGCVVLKPLARALHDGDQVYATILGSAINNDGAREPGISAPSAKGICQLVREALSNAGVAADSIGYVESHGDSAAELEGLARAYFATRDQPSTCALGTGDSQLDAAAGITGLLKALLALHHGVLPARARAQLRGTPFYACERAQPWQPTAVPRRAGVSALGIGGTNVHVVLEEAPARAAATDSQDLQLVPWSARDFDALQRRTDDLADFFERPEASDTALANVAFTLQSGRRHFAQRRFVVASTAAEALDALDLERWTGGVAPANPVPISFLFSGQGAQYGGMARGIYAREPVFREAFDACAMRVRALTGADLAQLVLESASPEGDALLGQTQWTQPALFATEYALAQLLLRLGFVPAQLLGHSVGEYVAACLAGVFSLDDALGLICERGRLMSTLPAGAMLTVPLSEHELQPLLGASLSLAAINAPGRSVVAGPSAEIDRLAAQLETRSTPGRRLRTSHAFHSAMMEPICEPFERCVAAARRSAPRIPLYSCVSGQRISDEEAVDPAYWARQLRAPVRFAAALEVLVREPSGVLLELGPGAALTTLALQQPAKSAGIVALPTLPAAERRGDDVAVLLNAIGRAWISGVDVAWSRWHERRARRRVPLPTYPFERSRHWIEPEPAVPSPALAPAPESPLSGSESVLAPEPPLLSLSEAERAHIALSVPGGADNVQDVYPLTPLQEGILFQHLLDPQADPYVSCALLRFDRRERLDAYVSGLQAAVDRHDILRTAVLWRELPEPVQVVWRSARLCVREESLDLRAGAIGAQLRARFADGSYAFWLGRAPLLRLHIACDPVTGHWFALQLTHHICGDNVSLSLLLAEVEAHMTSRSAELPEPLPFRAVVASARRHAREPGHADFFRELLAGVSETTAPFGFSSLQSARLGTTESRSSLDAELARRLRARARTLGVSPASIVHLAWGLVVARAAGSDDVVFGTVVMGRMLGIKGSERMLGPFINTLPFRLRIGSAGVEASLRQAHQLLVQLLRHEHTPLSTAQRQSGVAPPAPLFSALLNYRRSATASSLGHTEIWEGTEFLGAEERTHYPLSLTVDDLGNGFDLICCARAPVAAERVSAQMVKALSCVLDALELAPTRPLYALDVLPDAEHRQVTRDWNATETWLPSTACVQTLFEAHAARTPDAISVSHHDETLTYGELNRRANRLARRLQTLGVARDHTVALCLERGVPWLVGALAILKAGGAYVPLDPAAPAPRLRQLLADSRALLVLTRAGDTTAWADSSPVATLDVTQDWPDESSDNLPLQGTARQLAYVTYTSGSTGAPKGVMIEHRSVVRLVINSSYCALDANARVAFAANPSFDAATFEVWGPLLNGACVVVLDTYLLLDPTCLAAELARQSVTTLFVTTAIFNQCVAALPNAFAGLRTLLTGGERAEAAAFRRVLTAEGPAHLIHVYGPTETTTFATAHAVTQLAEDTTSVPIGRAIGNTRVYVLDSRFRPAAICAIGQLFIGGPGVARGYLDLPELTAQRFVPDPFSDDPGARLYATGDLCRFLPDGSLEFIGRNDHQVKLRGFRIELGEVEAQLSACAGVEEAIVVLREDSPGDKRLVAYYRSNAELAAETLRAQLAQALPAYMLPAAFVWRNELPLTPNGKVDRKALPAPEIGARAVSAHDYQAPSGEAETQLALLWAEALQVEHVGRHDDFFTLGGHSLLAVKLVERMRGLGMFTDVRRLFVAPTIAQLAATLHAPSTQVSVPPNLIPEDCSVLTPALLPLVSLTQAELDSVVGEVPGGAANVQDIYPLAPLQEGILFHHLLTQEGDTYLVSSQLACDTRSRLEALLGALQTVLNRHDILRTSVAWQGLTEPVQVVWRHATLPVQELLLDPELDASTQLRERLDPSRQRIALDQAPLLRAYVAFDAPQQRWLLALQLHHLVGDNVSLLNMLTEVQALLQGEERQLPKPQAYRNLVAQARLGVSAADHAAYFQRMFGDVTEPTAPFDVTNTHGVGADVGEAQLELAGELTQRLRRAARGLGVTTASLCHQAWALVLERVTQQDDVVFGTVLLGRMQGAKGSDSGQGLFINTLPLRVALGALGIAASVRQTHQRLAELMRHEHASLALAQRCSGVPAPLPLFTSLLNYRQRADAPGAGQPTWPGITVLHSDSRTNYPLTLSIDDTGHALTLTAHALRPIDADRVCALMQCALAQLTAALEQAPTRAASRLDVLPEAERARQLDMAYGGAAPFAEERCVHELFEAQAARTPHAIAVVDGERSLTFAELELRANRLAHHLRSLGVAPDTRVALCMERSAAQLLGVLAVLKAGGAYVPLDPAYPAERLRYMLQDSGAMVVLTQGRAVEAEWVTGSATPIVDATRHCGDDDPARPLTARELGLTTRHLAYVIYTSGSTGKPKGVAVEHRNLAHVAAALESALFAQHPECQRVSLNASFTFDVSVLQWLQLLYGRTLVVVPEEVRIDAAALRELIATEAIGLFECTPSQLAQVGAAAPVTLLAGEAVTASLWQRLAGAAETYYNLYGPTECTVYATLAVLNAGASPNIGRPIPNVRVYVLDPQLRPVPLGAAGELYLGGAGVARGYLQQTALTAERFVPDPFAHGARLYKTGDRVRQLADGSLEFLGRADDQVKLRGFRIELGEIESRLLAHPDVREAAVVVREDDPGDPRLIAYYGSRQALAAQILPEFLAEQLPHFMIPAAIVHMEALPHTSSGKLDRKRLRALPAPEQSRPDAYVPPRTRLELELVALWEELLHVRPIGVHDDFFTLGGHSLLAVKLVERMRGLGMFTDVRRLFVAPTIAQLAATLHAPSTQVSVPPNLIPEDCSVLTPALLPLVSLTQAELDSVVGEVPGGAANVQDIYPLAPLQEGILFHHLLTQEGDTYLVSSQLACDTRARLDALLGALQTVLNRHDILRTSVAWQGLTEPVQVVWRHATLPVQELLLDPERDTSTQLRERLDPSRQRIALDQAPLLRAYVAFDAPQQRWLLALQLHHLVGDNVSLLNMLTEVQALLQGEERQLPKPQAYRNLVAQARLGVSAADHAAYFQRMFGDVTEPTAPFDVTNTHGVGADVGEAQLELAAELTQRLRRAGRGLGVTTASLCHQAWALVLERVTQRDDVVFGTVLLGRMQGAKGSDSGQGLFINTLPLRVALGALGIAASVRQTHQRLADLMRHEHASLALAQRCSGVPAPLPLFTSLLNYRQRADAPGAGQPTWPGITVLHSDSRTNYPLTLSIDDTGHALTLTAHALRPIDADRVCALMQCALAQLTAALEQAPTRAASRLDVLPEAERARQLDMAYGGAAPFAEERRVHELFEAQAARTPHAIAVVDGERSLTFAELELRANRLAHHLRSLGVAPDTRVALCMERSAAQLLGVLAVLKAGGAYVPLDPAYPAERLRYMLHDSGAMVVLTQGRAVEAEWVTGSATPIVDATRHCGDDDPARPLTARELGLTTRHLAYVIYTSGSTGKPKGVAVEHRNLTHVAAALESALFAQHPECQRVSLNASFTFDMSVLQWLQLLYGRTLVVVPEEVRIDAAALRELIATEAIGLFECTPSQLAQVGAAAPVTLLGGEAVTASLWQHLAGAAETYYNGYGPTECTVYATLAVLNAGASPNIGRPIPNVRVYVLDSLLRPVPLTAAGELYLGGAGVARGYLQQTALTAERFVPDPFAHGARLYKTGDRVRQLADGSLEFLGRADDQVKLRGFRIELGEIEARLLTHPDVREAAVVVREDQPGDQRLIAYYSSRQALATQILPEFLAEQLPHFMIPAAIVHMEALPHTSSGKLDRKRLRALPAPEQSRPDAYVPPRTRLELELVALWEELLHVRPIGVHDDFFTLGGHSLLGVALMALVEARHQQRIPLRSLFPRVTVAELAARLEAPAIHEPSTLVTLQAAGAETPLVCVHAIGGSALSFLPLSAALGKDQPLHALHARGLEDDAIPSDDVRELAQRYLADVEQAGVKTPFLLAGWSFGALVAHEMACQLQRAGRPPAALVLIEPAAPHAVIDEASRPDDMIVAFARELGLTAEELAAVLAKPAAARWEALAQASEARGILPTGLGAPYLQRTRRVYQAHRTALVSHRPSHCAGRIVFIHAQDTLDGQPLADSSHQTEERWRPYLTGTSERHIVPGDHFTLLRSPQVVELAKVIEQLG